MWEVPGDSELYYIPFYGTGYAVITSDVDLQLGHGVGSWKPGS